MAKLVIGHELLHKDTSYRKAAQTEASSLSWESWTTLPEKNKKEDDDKGILFYFCDYVTLRIQNNHHELELTINKLYKTIYN